MMNQRIVSATIFLRHILNKVHIYANSINKKQGNDKNRISSSTATYKNVSLEKQTQTGETFRDLLHLTYFIHTTFSRNS